MLSPNPREKYSATDATTRSVDFQLCPSLESGVDLETERFEFNSKQPKNRSFFIEGALSEAECDFLIDSTEKIGYNKVDDILLEYPSNYRNNQRMIYISPQLASTLWLRIQKHISQDDIANVTPVGYCSDGIWVPVSLNDGIIFSKYSSGQYFKPHKDGLYINKNEEYSIFSVVVYLNQIPDGKGGNLNFIDPDNNFSVTASFPPKKGTAIIFNSDALHEGEELIDGYKFMLRTFIMFKCVHHFSDQNSVPLAQDPIWNEIVNLYSNVEHFSFGGDVNKFQEMYLRAQSLQLSKSGNIHVWNPILPMDSFRMIFQYLNTSQIMRTMLISKDWLKIARDNVTWKNIYLQKYLSIPEIHVNSFNFFGLYKERAYNMINNVLVIGDVCTYSNGDVCNQRTAGVVLNYSRWDGSMLEPLLLEDDDDKPGGNPQNWYNSKLRNIDGSGMHAISYFANLASQYTFNSNNLSNLLIITFPLHWALSGAENISTLSKINDNNPNDLTHVLDKYFNRFMFQKPENNTNDLENNVLLAQCKTDSKYMRISEERITQIQEYTLKNTSDYRYGPYDGQRKPLNLKFLEASVAACVACDVRKAKVIIYQPLVFNSLIQIVEIEDLMINDEKNLFHHFENFKTISESLLIDISKFSNNIIFICDKERDRKRFDKVFIPTILDSLKEKNDNINFWKPSHLDIYYGGKTFSKKYLTPCSFQLKILGSVILPDHIEYARMGDKQYFSKSGKSYKYRY